MSCQTCRTTSNLKKEKTNPRRLFCGKYCQRQYYNEIGKLTGDNNIDVMILLKLDDESLYNLLLYDEDMKDLVQKHPTFYISWIKDQFVRGVSDNEKLREIIINNYAKAILYQFVLNNEKAIYFVDAEYIKMLQIIGEDKKFARLFFAKPVNYEKVRDAILSQNQLLYLLSDALDLKKLLETIQNIDFYTKNDLQKKILQYLNLSFKDLFNFRNELGIYNVKDKMLSFDNVSEQFLKLKKELSETEYKELLKLFEIIFRNDKIIAFRIIKKLLPNLTFDETFFLAGHTFDKDLWFVIYSFLIKYYDIEKELKNSKADKMYINSFETKKKKFVK